MNADRPVSLIDRLLSRRARSADATPADGMRAEAAPRSPPAHRARLGQVPLALALVATIPVTTAISAFALARYVDAETAVIRDRLAPREAQAAQATRVRDQWRRLVQMPRALVRLDQLAAALGPDDRLVRAERRGDGTLRIDVMTADPAMLRARLARAAGLPAWRTIGERRGDAALVVSMVSR